MKKMDKILREIISWTFENKIIPEIYFSTISGGIYLTLTFRYNGKCISHEFYVGGVLCLENWDIGGCVDEEVKWFVEEAKCALLGTDMKGATG